MLRSVLAVIVGVIVAGLVVFLVQSLAHQLYPPPAGLDLSQPDALRSLVAGMPKAALLLVLLSYALGNLAGGFTGGWIQSARPLVAAWAIGLIECGLVGLNLAMIPHPLWMAAASILIPIPCALLGAHLARRKH